jgi:2-dehydro-3-deoxygalactonokinase
MATSNLGWCATPYVSTPAGPHDLWRHARVEDLRAPATASLPPRRLRLFFFPGRRTAVDVMRGEEVEALGVLEALEGASAGSERRLVVLPGTHSKWILCAGGRLLDFVTVPTGDLFAALHRETLLARTLPDGPAAVEGPLRERFDAGLRAAREAGPLSTLFHVRSRAVLEDHGWTPAECSAFLSGVLIGGEVIERWARRGDARVVLAGAEPLRRLYSRAFSVLAEDQVEALDRDLAGTVVVLGIRRLRRARPPGGAQSGTGL